MTADAEAREMLFKYSAVSREDAIREIAIVIRQRDESRSLKDGIATPSAREAKLIEAAYVEGVDAARAAAFALLRRVEIDENVFAAVAAATYALRQLKDRAASPSDAEARELLAAELRRDGIEPPRWLFELPLEEMGPHLGTHWPRSIRAITAALSQRDEARSQAVEMREALEKAVLAEREACARLAELRVKSGIAKTDHDHEAFAIAAAIRNRSADEIGRALGDGANK